MQTHPPEPDREAAPGRPRSFARTAIAAVALVVLVVSFGVNVFGGSGDGGHEGHHDGHVGVAVVEAWTAPSTEAVAVYLRLDNNGDEADRLVGATSDAAGTVALMGGAEVGHTATDAEQQGAIDLEVPPGSTALLPGERHLMLTDLAGPLEEGDTFTVRLDFEGTGPVDAEVDVVPWDEVVERS